MPLSRRRRRTRRRPCPSSSSSPSSDPKPIQPIKPAKPIQPLKALEDRIEALEHRLAEMSMKDEGGKTGGVRETEGRESKGCMW